MGTSQEHFLAIIIIGNVRRIVVHIKFIQVVI
jgi:hypothetical protein